MKLFVVLETKDGCKAFHGIYETEESALIYIKNRPDSYRHYCYILEYVVKS